MRAALKAIGAAAATTFVGLQALNDMFERFDKLADLALKWPALYKRLQGISLKFALL